MGTPVDWFSVFSIMSTLDDDGFWVVDEEPSLETDGPGTRGQLSHQRHLQSDFLHNLAFSVVWQRFFVLSVLYLSTFSAF